MRDADRGRRVPRRHCALARRFGAGAVARSWSAGADDAGPVSAPLQPRPSRPAQPGARRGVRTRASAARSGDGDARPRRDLYRASRPGRLAARDTRHLQRQGLLAPAALLCRRDGRVATRQAPQRPRRRLDRRDPLPGRVPAPAACRSSSVSACRRGLLGPGLLRRARAQADHLRRRGAADRLAARPDQRDRRRDWQPASYRDGSEVASFRWRPKTWKQERRFIVRRDPVEAGEQLTLEGREWHYWALVSNDSERTADELECWHRAKANLENQIKEAKLGLGLDNLPCQSFHANWAYLLCTLLAFNLLAWLKLLALPERERSSYVKRLRFRFIAVAATVGRSAAGSSSASRPATRSSTTSSQRYNASAASHAPPPELRSARNRDDHQPRGRSHHSQQRSRHPPRRHASPRSAARPEDHPRRPESPPTARISRLPQDPGS